VFVGASDGFLYELGLKDGKERWKHEIGRDVTASPAIGEGCLVIGGEGSNEFVYCFGKKP
jgi:outer membrane protein assembly factor BamB